MVTATATTLNALQLEAGCGWSGMFFSESFQGNITAAAGGGQSGAFQLTRQNSRVTTVATAGDSVMLPPALPGLEVIVVNHGANPMQVFGNGTDTIDDVATATGVPQMPDSTTLYYCMTPGNWYTEGLASGYVRGGVGSFQTMSVQTGITAHAGGGQASAVQLTAMNCFIATVATAGDSVKLPPCESRHGNRRARLSAIAAAAELIKAESFTIDGEAVVQGPDGLSRFEELSGREARSNRDPLRLRLDRA